MRKGSDYLFVGSCPGLFYGAVMGTTKRKCSRNSVGSSTKRSKPPMSIRDRFKRKLNIA